MHLDELSTTSGCIVTKNPLSFYFDSGLETEDDMKKPVDLTIDHSCFVSYLEFSYTGNTYYRGESVECYQCNAHTEIKVHNFKIDFMFTLYRNTVNNTYYTETDPELGPQEYPEDTGGSLNYYFLPDLLKMVFFIPPSYEDIYY
tara:strand:+ start:1351 stop:1782 length:432 start_codon:yes stop_codon:yes gene_type:complete